MDRGDSRKLSLPSSASLLTKKSMTFLKDTIRLAENTFQTPPSSQYGYYQQPDHSQQYNTNYHQPPPQHLYPPPAAPQHQPQYQPQHQTQQWPRPPQSPNRLPLSQTPSPRPYYHRPSASATTYVPGQGVVPISLPGPNAPALPLRHDAVAPSRPQGDDMPPPYPGHTVSPPPPTGSPQPQLQPLPQQQYQISPQFVPSGPVQHSWSPPNSQQQTPIQVPQQQQQSWGSSPLPPSHQQLQAYSPPLGPYPHSHLQHPPPPHRHPSEPNVHYRPQQFQPQHSNTYPSAAHPPLPRPSTSHSHQGQVGYDGPPPPLPSRPPMNQSQSSPQVSPQNTYPGQSPAGYTQMPLPPHAPQQDHQYFAPPQGVAEMYVPPPTPQQQQTTGMYAELPGNEPSGIQQGRTHSNAAVSDVKPPVQHGHGLGIPQIAELPG